VLAAPRQRAQTLPLQVTVQLFTARGREGSRSCSIRSAACCPDEPPAHARGLAFAHRAPRIIEPKTREAEMSKPAQISAPFLGAECAGCGRDDFHSGDAENR